MEQSTIQYWKDKLPEFREMTDKFHTGEVEKGAYKGYSGYFGSYAQRDGSRSMARLRMTAGRLTKEKLAYIAASIRKHGVDCAHFTTCQTVQLHNLKAEALYDIMEGAFDAGIYMGGGGGDFPRNIMCSPLTGVEEGEYFDVMPYAERAGEFLLGFVDAPQKMPRKLKVCFSNSPKNLPHATYRDLGFAANADGTFDVYSAGGLGNNPKFGVKVAEQVDPSEILYYIKAMRDTFCAYGDYKNRGRARTRYMQDILGGADKYREAFLEKLAAVRAEGTDLSVSVEPIVFDKKGDGVISGRRVLPQKQDGLYTVIWHPVGGQPKMESLCALSDTIAPMEQVEVRLAPDETAYIINLTAKEAEQVLAVTADSAETLFETSVSCIGASICQVGLRDSQALLTSCVQAVREAEIPDGALPQIHISGCTSSCGTHQTGAIGFRGAAKRVDDKPQQAFQLYVNGNEMQGGERMGRDLGAITVERIPQFLVELGRAVAAEGLTYAQWAEAHPNGIDELAEAYL